MTNTSIKRTVAGLAAAAIVFSAAGIPQLGSAVKNGGGLAITAEAASGVVTFYDNAGLVFNYATVDEFLGDFPDSINSLRSNGKLVLNADVDLGDRAMSIRQPMIFDLNGHTIKSSNANYTLHITGSTASDVTITDSVGGGKILSENSYESGNNAVFIRNGASVKFEDGTFESDNTAVRILSTKESQIEITGGTFIANKSGYYGLDQAENSSNLTLSGGTFYNGVFTAESELNNILQTGKAFYTLDGSAIDQTKNYNTNNLVVKDEDISNPAATFTVNGEIKKAVSASALYTILTEAESLNGTIDIYEDLDFGDKMLVLQNANLTINTNGHALTWNASGQGLVLSDSFVLFNGGSITNTMTGQKAILVSGSGSYAYFMGMDVSGNSSAFELSNGATAEVSGGTVSGVTHGIVVGGGTTLTFEDGTVSAINGYGINASGKLEINGGVFKGGDKAIYASGKPEIVVADGLGLVDDKGSSVNTSSILDYSTNTYKYLKAGTSTDVFGGQSLTLTDSIELNIYIKKADLEAAVGSGVADISATVDGKSITPEEQSKTVTVDGKECYVYKIPLYSTEMTKDVVFKVSNEEGKVISSLRTSAVDYAAQLLESTSVDAATKNTVVSMLNYGAAAQKYFGVKLTNLADKSLTSAQKSGIDETVIPQSMPSIPLGLTESLDDPTKLVYYGSNLTLLSDVGLYHYFKLDKTVDVGTISVKTDNGYKSTIKRNSNSNYVQIDCGETNVADLEKKIKVTITEGTDVYEISYSPLDYLYLATQAPSDKFASEAKYQNFLHLAKALYIYHSNANKM